MNASQPLPWKFIIKTLFRFSPLWCGVALFCGALGFAYSIVKSDLWEASQPLIVRDEASGSEVKLGRFSSQTDLQAAQETVLEMARNREVVTKALTELGPYSTFKGRNWPSTTVVGDVASQWISVRAPETSEFGKTEVIYLATKAETPKRAERFNELLYAALSDHLRDVRRLRADSIIVELRHACELAEANLNQASEQLTKFESSVGTDLGELRGLSESLSGDGGTSLIRSELEKDIRAAELELRKIEALQDLLVRSQEDTNHLLVSDADLLLSQPTLQKLKTGLIDAQLEASKLAGRVTATHPKMVAALRSQETIRSELRAEIDNVIRTMEPSMSLAKRKLQSLRDNQANLSQRLASLAKIRTEYSRLVSEVRSRTEILNQAQAALTEAEALRSAAVNTNLLASLSPPKAGEDPVGMGTTQLTMGAIAAGLLLGLGGVFLIAPNPNGQKFGRRQADTLGGRRAEDHTAGPRSPQRGFTAPATDRRAVNRLTGEPNHQAAAAESINARPQELATQEAPNIQVVPDAVAQPTPSHQSVNSTANPYVKITPVSQAIAAARPRPPVAPENAKTKPVATEHSELASQSKSSVAGRVHVVEPKNGTLDDSNATEATVLWSDAPSDFKATEESTRGNTSFPVDGTALLNEEIVRDLQNAARKNQGTPNNKSLMPSNEVRKA